MRHILRSTIGSCVCWLIRSYTSRDVYCIKKGVNIKLFVYFLSICIFAIYSTSVRWRERRQYRFSRLITITEIKAISCKHRKPYLMAGIWVKTRHINLVVSVELKFLWYYSKRPTRSSTHNDSLQNSIIWKHMTPICIWEIPRIKRLCSLRDNWIICFLLPFISSS